MLTTLSLCLKPALACKTALMGSKNIVINGDLLLTSKKPKLVVEKQQSSINQTSFTYKNNVLNICKSYPYLGTIMSHNGQFKLNINELCKKASRAMYTLLGNVSKFYAGNIKILIDLFDKMILPICTYNCEVLGASFFSSKSSPSNFLPEKQCKNPIDKLQGSF